MPNNTTCSFHLSSFDTSNFYCDTQNHSLQGFHEISLIVLVVVAILSPVAVVGNSLVLAAIWRNSSLRTPSYILLAGLAFSDFCTGIIIKPCFVANKLINLIDPQINVMDKNSWPTFYIITRAIGDGGFQYFFIMTLMIITFMSIERWLHMSQRSLITVRRLPRIFAVLFVLPIPLVVYHVKGNSDDKAFHIASVLVLLVCLSFTSVAYFKVFRIIGRHQQQIHANEASQNFAQSAINLEIYRNSAVSILYIVLIFYIGYLPMAITFGLALLNTDNVNTVASFYVSLAFVFSSSSLNPVLYLWRMKDIRNEVKTLVKQIFCREN